MLIIQGIEKFELIISIWHKEHSENFVTHLQRGFTVKT